MKTRRRGVGLIVIGALALTLGGMLARSPSSVAYAAAPLHTICLSPGHGGSDPGAINKTYGIREIDSNISIALQLETLLKNHPDAATLFDVVVTNRTADVELDGDARAAICNEAGAQTPGSDTVLWIHMNSSSDTRVDYFKAFWGKKTKDLQFCQEMTNTYNLTLPGSTTLLEKKAVGQFANKVLLNSTAPACLIESVFISNAAEGKYISENLPGRPREGQIAQQLYNGLLAWYDLN